jgi:hypothetical protein
MIILAFLGTPCPGNRAVLGMKAHQIHDQVDKAKDQCYRHILLMRAGMTECRYRAPACSI